MFLSLEYTVYLLVVFPLVFCLLSIVVYFSRLARKLPKQVRKTIGVIGMYQMREVLYQSRSFYGPLDFRQRRVYSMYHFVLRLPCICNNRSPFLVPKLVGSTEIHIVEI